MWAMMLLLAALTPLDWVKELGGTATADPQGRIVSLDLSRTWVNDSDLQRVGTFTELRSLDLSHTRVTQNVSPIYSDAMQMALQGHDATTISQHCGIARAEAELVVALVRNRNDGN